MSESYDDYPDDLKKQHTINELIVIVEHNGRVLTDVVNALELVISRVEALEKTQ